MTSAPELQRLSIEVAARRLEAADQLDDDVGAEDERLGVGGDSSRRDVGVALRVEVAHGDADQLEAGADAAGELVAVLEQQARHLGSRRIRRRAGRPGGCGIRSSRWHSRGVSRRAGRPRSRRARCTRAAPVAHGDDGGPPEVVVVARERPAVGAGGGHGEQVAGRDVAGQVVGVHDDVAALAVLAGDAHEGRVGIRDRGWRSAPSSRRRRARGGRCRSCRRRR